MLLQKRELILAEKPDNKEKINQEIKDNGKNEKKCIVLICDGDVSYNKSIINSAKESDISIYTILVGNDRNGEEVLDKIAKDTGGKSYYADTASEIEDAMYCLKEETISEIDKTDTDGDGLYDTYEIAGMRIPNGQVIYTDPLKADTDGDGLSDQEEMGRLKPNTTRRTKGKVAMCFQYKSNPRKKDTDGDGYNDKVDPRPKESDVTRVALSKEKDFLKIVDEDGKVYYGGHQGWYKSDLAKAGACGTVALANITAYMASTNDKYKSLYAYDNFKYNNFLNHMNKVYKYLTPLNVAVIKKSFGIWTANQVKNGMKKYAKDCGVKVKAVREGLKYNKEDATNYIISALEKDLPVAILLRNNKRFDGNKVTQPNGETWNQTTFAMHWMTITAIKIDNIKKKTTLKVSTWGGYAYLDLDDCVAEGKLNWELIYFE